MNTVDTHHKHTVFVCLFALRAPHFTSLNCTLILAVSWIYYPYLSSMPPSWESGTIHLSLPHLQLRLFIFVTISNITYYLSFLLLFLCTLSKTLKKKMRHQLFCFCLFGKMIYYMVHMPEESHKNNFSRQDTGYRR